MHSFSIEEHLSTSVFAKVQNAEDYRFLSVDCMDTLAVQCHMSKVYTVVW